MLLRQSLRPSLPVNNTPSPSKKIALMGPYGFGNLGDAAIQQAMIQNVHRRFPNAEIYGISGFYRLLFRLRFESPGIIQKAARFLLRFPIEMAGVLETYRFLKQIDLVIVSGGGQLDDYWGGAFQHPYSLMLWALLARLRGVPYLVVSVGAGPLASPLSRWFDRIALALASYRSYRDEKSKQYMADVAGFRRDDPVYPDLAFSLAKPAPVNTNSSRPFILQKNTVAVGPMAYFDPRVWPEKDQNVYMAYLAKLADFTHWLVAKGYDILLFPGEAVHDLDVINDLKGIMTRAGDGFDPDRILHPRIETVDELMPQLATADLVVASRFHGVLLSQLLSKPLVALSYHAKIDELMADTGQARYSLQIHDFELETLKTRFIELEANRETVSQQIAARVAEYRAALDEQYDRIFGKL
jgi:polysaccharide pyruvyl transferase WcaK-like protein